MNERKKRAERMYRILMEFGMRITLERPAEEDQKKMCDEFTLEKKSAHTSNI